MIVLHMFLTPSDFKSLYDKSNSFKVVLSLPNIVKNESELNIIKSKF